DAVGRSALRRFTHGYAAARAAHGRESLRIGADPEFVLLRRDGRIVSPARFLDPGDAAGCDTVVVGRRVRHPVAELRPDPATDPAELARHLRRLLRRAAARIPEPGLRRLAGGMPGP
ncbi:putative amidoligase domain-containing protein, partial [Paenibacillus sp. 598K]|uniref:putative amidoligase domain-containing protein n=1 Tax=Paenibacillus sp. 598K TaxID=1117987 RepID=UPI00406B97A6